MLTLLSAEETQAIAPEISGAATIVGGAREFQIDRISGSNTITAILDSQSGSNGYLQFAVNTGAVAKVTLTYDGSGTTGLGGIDL